MLQAKNFTGGFLRVFGRRFSKIIGKDNYKKNSEKTCEKSSDIAAFFTFNEFFF